MGIFDMIGGIFGGGDGGQRVGAGELMQLLENGEGVSVIDVRTEDEFRSGHIPGSVCVPLSALSGLDGLPFKGSIVLCCASGIRSARARGILLSMGVEAVDLKGGVKAWVSAGGRLTMG